MHNNPSSENHQNTAGVSANSPRPWWLGGLVVALGCLVLYGAYSLPQSSRYAVIGPGMFVSIVGAVLVILGLMLLYQISQGEHFEAQDAEDAEADLDADWGAFSLALIAAVIPIITIKALGYPLTATLSFTLVARAFGSRQTLIDIGIGASIGVISWFLFTRLGLQLGDFLPVAGL